MKLIYSLIKCELFKKIQTDSWCQSIEPKLLWPAGSAHSLLLRISYTWVCVGGKIRTFIYSILVPFLFILFGIHFTLESSTLDIVYLYICVRCFVHVNSILIRNKNKRRQEIIIITINARRDRKNDKNVPKYYWCFVFESNFLRTFTATVVVAVVLVDSFETFATVPLSRSLSLHFSLILHWL